MPVFNPAPQGATLPGNADVAWRGRWASGRRKPFRSTKLPPAQTFMAVDRRIDGCPAPLTMSDYRNRASTLAFRRSDAPNKGDWHVTCAQPAFRNRLLRDLLRDLPLSDRLRRRPSVFAKTVDSARIAGAGRCRVIDVALIALFGLQHSVMARPGVQARVDADRPAAVERSVYVLFASIALIILFDFWQPIDTIVWAVRPDLRWLSDILWALFWAGFGIVLISTFLINHFELFGLQQAWLNVRGKQAAAPELRQPLFYRWVAHPLYAGFFLAFWAAPQMTAGHLLLAVGISIYMLIAIRYEEHDLDRFVRRGLPPLSLGRRNADAAVQAAERVDLAPSPALQGSMD